MKLLPKGISFYKEIIDRSRYFVDKTRFISMMDKGDDSFLFFVRPRRFGKSLFLSMLEVYYDVAVKDQFEHYFKGTWIHDHVTDDQGRYQVIHLDFSKISADLELLENNFDQVVGYEITAQAGKYRASYDDDFLTVMNGFSKAKDKLNHFCVQARLRGYMTYLLVDEYDNFTSTILHSSRSSYLDITHGTGFYREFFKVAKTGFTRIFMTGVTPVTMDDLTSGFNIATNISMDPRYNSMMGFSTEELMNMIEYYRSEGCIAGAATEKIVASMEPWYDNYCFSKDAFQNKDHVYNSYMVLYYLSALINSGHEPDSLIVPNTLVDYNKLRQIVDLDWLLNRDSEDTEDELQNGLLEELLTGKCLTSLVVPSFPAEDIAETSNFISYLYYLGMLTVVGLDLGQTVLGIPNLHVRLQFYEILRKLCLKKSDSKVSNEILSHIRRAAAEGSVRPLAQAIVDLCARYSGNRQLRQREGLFQAFFLAFLSLDPMYEVAPEIELRHGYNDIFMFPRKGVGVKHSYIIELKYVSTDSPQSETERVCREAQDQLDRYASDPKVGILCQDTVLHRVMLVIKGFEITKFEDDQEN